MATRLKKIMIGTTLLAVAAGGYAGYAHFTGGEVPTLGLPIGGARAELRTLTMSFWEDIKFKDYKKAASYQAETKRSESSISALVEQVFGLPAQSVDLMEFSVVEAELDSTGNRARLKSRVKAKDLVKGKVHTREVMHFFHRDTPQAAWVLDLDHTVNRLAQQNPGSAPVVTPTPGARVSPPRDTPATAGGMAVEPAAPTVTPPVATGAAAPDAPPTDEAPSPGTRADGQVGTVVPPVVPAVVPPAPASGVPVPRTPEPVEPKPGQPAPGTPGAASEGAAPGTEMGAETEAADNTAPQSAGSR